MWNQTPPSPSQSVTVMPEHARVEVGLLVDRAGEEVDVAELARRADDPVAGGPDM